MLSEAQLYVLAFIAPIVVYIVNALLKARVTIHRGWLTAGVYFISGLLAFAWNAPVFPPFPPFVEFGAFIPALFQWITALLTVIGPIVALATLVYNALLKKVLDGISQKYFAA